VDLDTVLDAARLLEQRRLPVRIVLCGTGPHYDHLRRRAEALGNVCLPGWIGGREIAALMQMSAAGLAPYRNNAGFADNYPNKTIEYMSAGLPVISSLQGRFRTLVTQRACGLNYNSDAPHELAAAIERLCAEPAMRGELARNARELFEEQFDGRKVYGAMIDYLIDVAGAGAR